MNNFNTGLILIKFKNHELISYLINEQIISNGIFYPIIRINLPIKKDNEYLSTIMPDSEIKLIKSIQKTNDFFNEYKEEILILKNNGWDFDNQNNLETINLLYYLRQNIKSNNQNISKEDIFKSSIEKLQNIIHLLENHYIEEFNNILKEYGFI